MIKYKDKELILSYYKDNEIKGLIYTDNIIFGNVNLSEWEEYKIEQVGWTVDLNNQWQLATVRQDKDTNFQTYQSFSNYNVSSGWARMKVNIAKGLSEFTLHFGSYAESNYDFTLVGNLDANMSTSTSTLTGTTSTTWKQTSIGKQSANAPDIVVKYDIADTSKEHFIWIAYKKDDSVNSYDDRGYVSFDKRLVFSIDGWRKKEYSYSARTISDYVYDFYLAEKWVYSEDKETIIKEDPLTATTEQLETRLIDGEDTDTFQYGNYIYYKKYYQVKLNNQWENTDYYTFGEIKEEVKETWIQLTRTTDRNIPMQRFRIKLTTTSDSKVFISFSKLPNQTGSGGTSNTGNNVCISPEANQASIGYDGTRPKISSVGTLVSGTTDTYDFTFPYIVYFNGAEANAKVQNVWYWGTPQSEIPIQYIDYVYNNVSIEKILNQYPDENTIVQLKYYNISGTGGNLVGSQNNTDSNYKWRYFHYSNSIYFDAYGVRTNGGSNQGLTGTLYEREMGYDSSTKTKYVKNITERDTIVGSTGTNIISTTSVNMTKAAFSTSDKFNIFHDNTMRVYYMKIYKNGVMVNNYRPVKFTDGSYGLYDMITHEEVKDSRILGSE